MTPKGVFRLLILSSLLLGVGGGVADVVFQDRLPAPLQAWEQAEADREPTTGEIVVGLAAVAFLLAFLANTVGLLLFWRPARPVGVALAALIVAVSAAAGPLVSFGWVLAVSDLACLLQGVTLAMAYCWPPIRVLFDGTRVGLQDAQSGSGEALAGPRPVP